MSGIIGQVGARSGVVGSTTDSTQLDYEEGVWTPTFIDYSDSTTVQGAKYTKIGRQVICECEIAFGSNSDSDRIEISLPFSASNKGGAFIRWTDLGGTTPILGHVSGSSVYWITPSAGFYTYSNFSSKRLDFVAVFIV